MPGFFAGMEALAERGGRLSLQDLFAPAISAAVNGVEVTPYQHYLATVVEPILMATTASQRLFAPNGGLQVAGEIFRNPSLAVTFRDVAAAGWSKSNVPDQVLKEQAEHGHVTDADLSAYQVEERNPISLNFGRGHVFMNPLPAASGTLIRYALEHLGSSEPVDFAQALRKADEARVAARGDLGKLLARPVRQHGTTHVSAVDGNRNACAITVSNGAGSGEMVGECGFMLNNILGEEDVNPHGSADWPLNTRLASMMCPTLIDLPDGRLTALGSGGSSRIRSAIFQTVARLCLADEGLDSAIDRPRLHVEDGHLDFEGFFPEEDIDKLTATFPDHRRWSERSMFFGGVHGVAINDHNDFCGKGDGRRDGVAIVVD